MIDLNYRGSISFRMREKSKKEKVQKKAMPSFMNEGLIVSSKHKKDVSKQEGFPRGARARLLSACYISLDSFTQTSHTQVNVKKICTHHTLQDTFIVRQRR